jgi:hypothetical protein
VTPANAASGIAASLPGAVTRLVPELGVLPLSGESRADCQRCVLLPDSLGAADHPWAFHPSTRCCTYHPELPNFLAGQALERGGPGAERIRARLHDPSGVSAWGIMPSNGFRSSRAATITGFGRDPAMRCPFYVSGPYTCGIWQDRNSVCRTWFCRHDEGVVGLARWTALRKTLTLVEKLLAEFCVTAGQPPDARAGPGHIDIAAWEAWFVWCAGRIAAMSDAELAGVSTSELSSLRRQMASCMRLPPPHLPDVVVPVLRASKTTPRGIGLEGYSSYDGIEVDPGIIHFFARLDGKRTWRQARDLATAERGVAITDELVAELGRIHVLQTPARVFEDAAEKGLALPPGHDRAHIPEIVIPSAQKPLIAGDEVWIQGQVPLASVIAPRSIFRFLARLDGTTPWRDALAQVRAERDHPGEALTQALVIELYRIGALGPPDASSEHPSALST